MQRHGDRRPRRLIERRAEALLLVVGKVADALVVLAEEPHAPLADRVLVGELVLDRHVEGAAEEGELAVDRRGRQAGFLAAVDVARDVAGLDLAERQCPQRGIPEGRVLRVQGSGDAKSGKPTKIR